jgi:hypothetical protein
MPGTIGAVLIVRGDYDFSVAVGVELVTEVFPEELVL